MNRHQRVLSERTTIGPESRADGSGRGPRFGKTARLLSLYVLVAGFLVVMAAALDAFGVFPKRLAAIVSFSTIVFCGVFWGPWSAIGAALVGVLFIDYVLVSPPMVFSVPSLRESVLLLGLSGSGVLIAALSTQIGPLRQRLHSLAESGYLQNRLFSEGIGPASVLVLALALNAVGAPKGRLMVIAPFFVVVALTAIFCSGRQANVTAVASVVLIDYFLLSPAGDFSVPTRRDAGMLIGIVAFAVVLGAVSDHRRGARRQAEASAQSEQLQRTLLRVISHDLKTPLTTIIGSLHTLRDATLSLPEETRRELATIAYDQANRLNRLVAGILEMTRLEAGTTSIKNALCDVEDVVDEAMGQLQETLHGRRCVIRLPSSLPQVRGDTVLLSHALANLLHNAAKFSPDGTPIEVTADAQDKAIVVSVADQGQGIPPGDLDRVFEKFYRLRQSRDEDTGVGTGLGLAVAKGIVEAHGGRIWAEHREGGGTIMRISLPLT